MASCPRCGFDLTSKGSCPVCGYAPTADPLPRSAPTSPAPAPGASAQRKRRNLGIGLAVLAVVLLAASLLSWRSGAPRGDRGAAAGVSTAGPVAASADTAGPVTAGPVAAAAGMAGADTAGADTASADGAGPVTASAVAAHPTPASTTTAVDGTRDGSTGGPTVAAEGMPLKDGQAFVRWMLQHSGEKEEFLRAKWERAQVALGRGDITSDRMLQAFLKAPREYFCKEWNLPKAYANAALSIGYGQTISGPHMVARMTDNLELEPRHSVLEIGTGSGYQAAVLAELTDHVFTVEIVPELAQQADAIYTNLEDRYPEYRNIERKNADGYYGWPEHAPFDRIIVTAGIDHVPPALMQQLSPGGIMVIPVGPPSGQTVLKITKQVGPDGSVSLSREDIFHGRRSPIVFVPFTSAEGGVHSLQDQGGN
jgi:protein-L-isoaspartate(D-aspartate) O-methyltransferase